MKIKYFILVVLIQLSVEANLVSQAIDLVDKLKFDRVPINFDEGLRSIVSIYEIKDDHRGVIWVGGIKGLYRYNGSSTLDMTERINKKQSNIVSSEWVTKLNVDSFNRVWFGTTKGLYVFDQETEICSHVFLLPESEVSNDNSYITEIEFLKDKVYIGTSDGLYRVDPKSLRAESSYMTKGEKYIRKGTYSSIFSIHPEISDSSLWFSSRSGIHELNFQRNRIDTFLREDDVKIENNYFANGVFIDNEIVLGDYKYGIVHLDIFNKSITNFAPTNEEWIKLKSIIHIEDDLLLVNAENKGIGVYNRISNSYKWLKTEGNVKSSRYNLFKDSDGYIWFATNGEIFRSNMSFPEKVHTSKTSIDIDYVFANGERINSKLGRVDTLFLDYQKNNVQLNYSLTKSQLYDDLSYEYQLNTAEWASIKDDNKLELFDLSAGKNRLKIRAIDGSVEIANSTILLNVHRPFSQSPSSKILLVLGFLGLISGIYYYNRKQYRKAAEIKSRYEYRLANLESQALRSQINPHFIFNTLNSIKYYSIEKTPEETSDFISSFSTLIRRILENSKKNLIPLSEEIETLKNYTEIEALRFHEHFKVEYSIDEKVDTDRFLIPPMIIQPFIENAIWHGLMHKEGERILKINFVKDGLGVCCEIIDNGIGREASSRFKNKSNHKSSLGMKITEERMELINIRNLTNNSFEIEDLVDVNGSSAGTKVTIKFLPKENYEK